MAPLMPPLAQLLPAESAAPLALPPQDSEMAELRGTVAADKMAGKLHSPADVPTKVRRAMYAG